LGFTDLKLRFTVIPAQAGIQIAALVSRLRGNDVTQKRRFDKALSPEFARLSLQGLGVVSSAFGPGDSDGPDQSAL
jgi:hypothetical protein